METIRCKNNFGKIVEIPRDKFFFRPSVYALIIQNGKILTLRNKSNKKIWFPGGAVEIGEKLEEALRREVLEETGIEVEIEKLLLSKENFFYYEPLDEAYHAFLFFFLCRPLSTELIPDDQVDDLESKEPRWTKMEDIKKEDLHDLEEDIFKIISELK